MSSKTKSTAQLKKDAISNVKSMVKNRGEYQFRHPVITNGKWKDITVAIKKSPDTWWDKFVGFLKDSKIISSFADVAGAAVGGFLGGAQGAQIGAQVGGVAGDIASSQGFGSYKIDARSGVMLPTTTRRVTHRKPTSYTATSMRKPRTRKTKK